MWQPRSLICSTQLLYFGNVDSEVAIGIIPLWEITKVQTAAEREKLKATENEPMDLSQKAYLRKDTKVRDVLSSVLEISTKLEGKNAGRKFKFKASSTEMCQDIERRLLLLVKQAIEREERKTTWQKSQAQVSRVFNSGPFQMGSAGLIFANFLFNVIQNQDCPRGCDNDKLYEDIDLLFTIIFTIELIINAYGHWFPPFHSCSARACS